MLERMSDAILTDWRKSSFSFSNGNCAEVGTAPGVVGVRDTRDRGAGPVLLFAADSWRAFATALKAGTLDP